MNSSVTFHQEVAYSFHWLQGSSRSSFDYSLQPVHRMTDQARKCNAGTWRSEVLRSVRGSYKGNCVAITEEQKLLIKLLGELDLKATLDN
jgi:hypothetical protein